MPFELCNAPTMFTTLMNNIFHEYLDDFVTIYIDDILMYSKTTKKHAETLQEGVPETSVEQVVRKGGQIQLGQVADQVPRARVDVRGVIVDDQKIKAILKWEKPKTTKGLRSFIGLASYYLKFVRGFVKIIKPLLDISKKSV